MDWAEKPACVVSLSDSLQLEVGHTTTLPSDHLWRGPTCPRCIELAAGQALVWVPNQIVESEWMSPLPDWAKWVMHRLSGPTPPRADRLMTALQYFEMEWHLESTTPYSAVTFATKLQGYLEEHMDQSLDLEELARAFAMSRSGFLRTCQREVGVPPMRWLAQLRIQRAKALLLEPELTISQVGYRIGFDAPATFSHFFKKHVGMSPRAYRQQGEWLL